MNNYFNMEPLTLEISYEVVAKMMETNHTEGIIDQNLFYKNIKYGFIALTQIVCYHESFLNTILNRCMECDTENLLKLSMEEKLEMIFLYFHKDIQMIKSYHCYSTFRSAARVRNELIHHKKTYIGDGLALPDVKYGKILLSEFMTKENIEKCINETRQLSRKIAHELDLKLNERVNVFECNGRDNLVNYVYNKETILVDPARYTVDGSSEVSFGACDDTYQFITEMKDSELLQFRKTLNIRRDEIVKRIDIEANDINYTNSEYTAIITDLVHVNKELYSRDIDSVNALAEIEKVVQGTPILRNYDDSLNRVEVDYYKWNTDKTLTKTAVIEMKYDDETTLESFGRKLGFSHSAFNFLDSKSLHPIYIEIPFIEHSDEVLWNLSYDNVTVKDYLSYYENQVISVCPFNPELVGGIGAAEPDLFIQIYEELHSFFLNNPLLTSIIASAIFEVIKNGLEKFIYQIKKLEDERANITSMKLHLAKRDCWSEAELMRIYRIDSPESIELIMLALGYGKKNGVYSKIQNSENNEHNP